VKRWKLSPARQHLVLVLLPYLSAPYGTIALELPPSLSSVKSRALLPGRFFDMGSLATQDADAAPGGKR
jgi:hypothetical protein